MIRYSFGSSKAFILRLRRALENKEKLAFLVGSGLTSPRYDPYQPGVLSVSDIVEEIKRNLTKYGSLEVFDDELKNSGGENDYQIAMKTLLMCAGQEELNKVITSAVLAARSSPEKVIKSDVIDQAAMESDIDIWNIRSGVDSIAKLVLAYKDVFCSPVLTTNFDPLFEIAIKKNGGKAVTVFLTNDGSFDNVLAKDSVHVVHLHGYWYGSDTLHTNDQITKARPLLKGSLKKMLQDNTLVVLGYGGWNDVLTKTIIEVAEEGGNFKNILWTFFSDNEDDIIKRYKFILEGFKSTINQRVVLYKGIDADNVFNELAGSVLTVLPKEVLDGKEKNVFDNETISHYHTELPPIASTWAGRVSEIDSLAKANSKVVFVTGIGGQGKSGLASYYIREKLDRERWLIWDWRDCKEEANRLHTKIVSVIERFSNGRIKSFEIKDEKIDTLINLLFDTISGLKIVFVFDNVDQYIDLEKFCPSGPLNLLYNAILEKQHSSQFIFTCRPEIRIDRSDVTLIHLSGLAFEETQMLFSISGLDVLDSRVEDLIKESFKLTAGHPLLLNIIIGQTKRDLNVGIKFVKDIKTNGNLHTLTVAESILKSVWVSLNYKQQILLRGIAEMVRPETEETLANILETELQSFNQFSKALRALKSLNLIILRSLTNQKDMIDLHPLVKQFVRDKYPKNERSKYITLFVNYYDNLVVIIKKTLSPETPLSIFENWTSKIELEIAKDDYKSALVSLQEIHDPILSAGYHEEYLRVASQLFSTIDWRKAILEEYLYFHEQLREFIWISIHMGRSEVESFLEQYLSLISGKSIQYLSYCDLQCYYHWFNGDFNTSISWGEKGMQLKEASNIEAGFELEHNLNLAYRDSRVKENVMKALNFFLKGDSIEEVLSLEKPDGRNEGTFFGNVGKCYEYLGEHELALSCYKKSFIFLSQVKTSNTVVNIGYAAVWIGDYLSDVKANKVGALMFYKFAARIWEKTALSRARSVKDKILKLVNLPDFDHRYRKATDFEVDNYCRNFCEKS